jgi:hypothetical protein
MLNFAFSYCYVECRYAECHYAVAFSYRYAECRYAECRGAVCMRVSGKHFQVSLTSSQKHYSPTPSLASPTANNLSNENFCHRKQTL